jgi:fluoride exporter
MVWLLIGLGGALGAMARHGVSVASHARYGADPFPVGVLVVNVLGCLLAGVLAGLLASMRVHLPTEARTFLMVGLLGGFTTFSAFGVDTFTLLHSGHYGTAALNVVAQVGLTLIAVWAGFALASA